MNYADRPGKSPVERFMRHYFLHAKTVGDLTGVFLSHLDEKFARRGRRLRLPDDPPPAGKLEGFVLDRGRLALPATASSGGSRALHPDLRARRQIRLEIHPLAMRAAGRDAKLIDNEVRADSAPTPLPRRAHPPRDPETVLRWMNEAGVFGRFVPDFGRVVAQMQFDMYHHYTVDEHTIRAIGLLARIERGELREDHPLATRIFRHIASRRVLYAAVLLHDIAKGRGGDHSLLGAEVARELCPRFGLDESETETVAWLVRWHLLMSATAFKRDLSDPKTIADFCGRVKSLERLRLLLILTVVDIRAVGPAVWNSWKRQLLRELFDTAEEHLRLGHKQRGRASGWSRSGRSWRSAWDGGEPASQLPRLAPADSYWLAEPLEVLEPMRASWRPRSRADEDRAALDRRAGRARRRPSHRLAKGSAACFTGLTGASAWPAANVNRRGVPHVQRRIALDNFLIQDRRAGCRFGDPRIQLERLRSGSSKHWRGRSRWSAAGSQAAPARPLGSLSTSSPPCSSIMRRRTATAWSRSTPATARRFLSGLARAIFQSKATVHSATSPPTASGRWTSSTSPTAMARRSRARPSSRRCRRGC
jgi:[protein-PII] uridylyltransferase